MFYIKNQGLVENKDDELRSVSPSREIHQNLSCTHTFVQIGASTNDCLERDQNSEITSIRDIDQIQNYSTVGELAGGILAVSRRRYISSRR